MSSELKISIVVPTYRRPADLMRCLDGIDRQLSLPGDVVIVCRDTDGETRRAVREWIGVPASYKKKMVSVHAPGVLIAMRAGTEAAEGEVVAYTDDDAVPRPSWLAKLASHFADPAVGGAGGRDAQPGIPAGKGEVGRITWYGKLIGNHHVGSGSAKEADVLKGVNMAFRKGLVAFPEGLLGQGAQVHFEVHVCLRIRRQGYKLIYDPEAVVDHYPAQRFDLDQRNAFVSDAVRHAAYNLHSGILTWGGALQIPARIVYALLVGDRDAPGAARMFAACLRGEREVVRAFVPGQSGQWQSFWRTFRRQNPRFAEGFVRQRRNAK